MKNNKFKLLFVTVILLALLCACGTSQNATETTNLPGPTPYDTQASSDDKQRLDFFRQGGVWSFLVNSPDDSEWQVVILGQKNALSGKELQLGAASAPSLDSTDAMKLIVKLISAEQEKDRTTFFRLYADGIDQGDFEAFLVKTAPLGNGASVSISNATSLGKQEFLDLVIPK